MKTSHAFAAFRRSLITECNVELHEGCVLPFIAEAVDIDKKHEETLIDAGLAPTPVVKATLTRLADEQRAARRLDLVERRRKFVAELREKFQNGIVQRIKEYNGETKGEVVVFPDASTASFPKTLFVDYTPFKQW